MALGLLCTSATFAVWTSGGGLETRQFSFFIVAAVVTLSLYQDSRTGLISASLCLAAAELTRPEGLLLAACCFTWFGIQRLVKDKSIDARLVKDTAYLVAPFALIVAAHFLFRFAYYGDWLPNTYYAKHVRPWYESGFRYLVAAAIETGLYLLLPLAYFALRTRWKSLHDGIYSLSLLCVIAHMAYLLPIGGDHFEYRPLDFYWPLLALPAAEAIALLGAKAATSLRRLPRPPAWMIGGGVYTIAFFLPILFYANAIQGALLFEGTAIRGRVLHVYVELFEKNARWLLAAPGMPALTAISNDLRRQSTQQHVGTPLPEHREFQIEQRQLYGPYEEMERDFIPDDALASDGGIGKFYYIPDLNVIGSHGLTDVTIARTPVTYANAHRLMAHDRQPPPEYLKQRGVNFEIYPASSNPGQALQHANYAVKFGPNLWMPFDTLSAQWATKRFADRELQARGTFSTVDPARNYLRVGRSTYVGQRFLGLFENGFDGWRVTGDAITNYNQHEIYEGQSLIWNRAADGFLTSYHHGRGNRATARALSPTFTATADQYLAFLIAGGEGKGVGLRLLADGEEVAVWHGRNSDWLPNSALFRLVVHPLGYVAGKNLQLELFDRELGDWGYIMLDHVMLATCDLCPQEPIALAQALNTQPAGDDTVYIIPSFESQFAVRHHLPSQEIAHSLIFRMDAPDLVPEVESALAAKRNLNIVKVVEWKSTNPWIDNDARPLTFLLAKYGSFLEGEYNEDFKIWSYADVSFESPWKYYEQLEPLTINYDGGIALQRLALGHGAEQVPFGQPLELGPDRSFWSVLQWQTEPELDVDYVLSLRLYNADEERAHQQDTVLWNQAHWPTSHWLAGESVETTALLHLPADLPPGDYELRLVVYDFETQVPTVQIDVWEPETTLARLQLTETR